MIRVQGHSVSYFQGTFDVVSQKSCKEIGILMHFGNVESLVFIQYRLLVKPALKGLIIFLCAISDV